MKLTDKQKKVLYLLPSPDVDKKHKPSLDNQGDMIESST